MGRGIMVCFCGNRPRAGRCVKVLSVLDLLCASSGQVFLNFCQDFSAGRLSHSYAASSADGGIVLSRPCRNRECVVNFLSVPRKSGGTWKQRRSRLTSGSGTSTSGISPRYVCLYIWLMGCFPMAVYRLFFHFIYSCCTYSIFVVAIDFGFSLPRFLFLAFALLFCDC